tara:strand:+ start:38 stop:1393 length:1356 start_codon:yes stop_codon:yes gene_type:complete
MEDHKFSNSNLDFNELFDKYKTLNTTYSDSDIVDFKINIYENCNLLQELTTTFTVPSTNIRLSSFKNNYIIADTQSLNLNQAFYDSNTSLFATFSVGNVTYINNINLTNIIKTHFNYNNDDIYPSKKIIITINLPNEIVDIDGSGALQIDMQEIKEHFHSLFDTLELDINQYVTGKHGELQYTYIHPPDGNRGGRGQNANLDSAGPAINITNNDRSYFDLNIKTNGEVSGGFGASGGNGGNGKIDATEYVLTNTTGNDTEYYSPIDIFNIVDSTETAKFVNVLSEVKITGMRMTYYWKNTTYYWWNGLIKEISMEDITIGSAADYILNPNPPTLSPAAYPEFSIASSYDATTNVFTKTTNQYVAGTAVSGLNNFWNIKLLQYTYEKTGPFGPSSGGTGSTASYSNNAGNPFDTRNGNTGTANDGHEGVGGTKGNPGGITNITATNIIITES